MPMSTNVGTPREWKQVRKPEDDRSDDIIGTGEKSRVDLQDNGDEVVIVLTGDIMTTSGDDSEGPSNQELISDNCIKGNKGGMESNDLIETKGEPEVDIHDDEDGVVIVPTSNIMTTSCDDSEGPSKKTNQELASDNHVKNSKRGMKNNNLAGIRGLRTDS
ncbi:16470_t:CDS:2 [Acaulospora morrowiae]|uniref:16470_t:CDS:1 n=1 Tax=Acaulospora morrowiae TaxID=94023 RepID=A0A9N9DVD5_9GLOM|nr:16470_t:CDS:2 [Acaulospora morrowiae]